MTKPLKARGVSKTPGRIVYYDSRRRRGDRQGEWVVIITDLWPGGAKRIRHIGLKLYTQDQKEAALAAGAAIV
jgi:hypothetical protein